MSREALQVVDLRSDTVTRPTPAMRRAIADAEVGDDVYGEDPTVARLEERVADLLGMEAALLVPSGSMANLVAIRAHTVHGDEVHVGQGAHSWLYESGSAGAVAGVHVCLLPGDGRFSGAAVREAYKPDDHHHAPTRLVMLENTHNMGGGLCWEAAAIREVQGAATELGLRIHLDGARLWNAAIASGSTERELARGFDSASVCMSKGLGAPVGSLVAGSRDFVHRAHRIRKMLGGGMRQAGVLAAAGLHAIEHHRARLAEDHDNAAYLARELSRLPGLAVDLDRVQTNIVMVDLEQPGRQSAEALAGRAAARGILFLALSPTRLRLVTHLDVDRAAVTRAVETIATSLSG